MLNNQHFTDEEIVGERRSIKPSLSLWMFCLNPTDLLRAPISISIISGLPSPIPFPGDAKVWTEDDFYSPKF